VSITREDDASTSDSDTGTDGSGHDNSDSNRLRQVECEDEFKDTELEVLVKSEGPQEILQLILQEQVDGFMEEEIIDADDYADWMRWVSNAEQCRQAMYESTHDAAVPLLLQEPSRVHVPSIPAQFLQKVKLIASIHENVLLNVEQAQKKQKKTYDGRKGK
jgi:hypothetical protein